MKFFPFINILLISISISGQSIYEIGNNNISQKYQSSDLPCLNSFNNSWIDLSTTWTYEARETFGNGITHINYKVVDTTTLKGKKVFKIKNGTSNYDENIMFSFEDSKGYIFDSINEKFNLFIDYSSADSFEFTTMIMDVNNINKSINGIAYVDSVGIFTMPDGSDSYIHYFTYKATIDGIERKVSRKALRNIGFIDGNSTGGWELGLWYRPLYEPELFATKLRCFSNDSVNFNFVGYACDSTWVKSNVNDFDSEDLVIFPNPVKSGNELNIVTEGEKYNVKIFDEYGKLILSKNIEGQINKLKLPANLKSGQYYLNFRSEKHIANRVLTVIE